MRRIAILGCSLILTVSTACGTTGTAEPTTPGAEAITATGPQGTGTTDSGSRFATGMDPIGGLTVETAPVEGAVPVAAPPRPAPLPAPAPAAAPAPEPAAPQPPEPKAAPDYGYPPLPPAGWTTTQDR